MGVATRIQRTAYAFVSLCSEIGVVQPAVGRAGPVLQAEGAAMSSLGRLAPARASNSSREGASLSPGGRRGAAAWAPVPGPGGRSTGPPAARLVDQAEAPAPPQQPGCCQQISSRVQPVRPGSPEGFSLR